MPRFLFLVSMAIVATLPALVLRLAKLAVDPRMEVLLFGSAILAAGFMLSWGAETAEKYVAQGLIVAVLALVTVLPEYAVDIYFALKAGHDPESKYVHYAAANMTGANRLLIGAAWPVMLLLLWLRSRKRSIDLPLRNSIEIGFLLLATLYSFIMLLKNRIDIVDSAVLLCIFGAYVWRVGRLPKESDEESEDAGPAAALTHLPAKTQWTAITGLTVAAATVILVSAEPFAESLINTGRRLGFSEFLLIQWLAPLASEAPAITLAALFVWSGRAATGLGTMLSDKINQWTLLVGMLPLAMSIGGGHLQSLPLDARQHEEFFLTAGQSLFGVAVLLRLRLGSLGAIALVGLFVAQLVLAFAYRDDEAATIRSLTALGWAYVAAAALIFATRHQSLWSLWQNAWRRAADS